MDASHEFRVMTSGAFTAAHLELIPHMERMTNKKVVTVTTSVGTGETSIENRLKRGEITDLVIVTESLLQGFVDAGLVLPDGRMRVARSSIALAVRAGAPKPDVSTAESLKRTLLEAKSIAYSASVSGQYLTTELYQRLGIAEECLPKSRFVSGGERTGAVVARGEADIAVQQMSELLPVQGIAHITPLPPGLQKASYVWAGVGAKTRDRQLARQVIAFLASREAAPAIAKTGLEPVTPQVA